ncbi:MAG: class I SAM-dependent methyltransferase [Bauldia sp.]
MTPLAEKLAQRIRAAGPITVAEYMAACLSDAEHGYYMRREPFGKAGDFITAPEVSQMFGELIGLWLVAAWERMGEPPRFVLAELGPGRGTLMADILRTALIKPGFLEAAEVNLVEISPRLRQVQAKTLSASGAAIGWHAGLDDLPAGPTLLVANEFFDAMPIRQFQWSSDGWAERVVDLGEDGRLVLGLRPVDERPPAVPLPENAVIETSAGGEAVMTGLAGRLAGQGGAALIIDYGSGRPGYGDTLQAVRNHAYDNPLATPGEADLTAHVDFVALARAASAAGAHCRAVMSQGEFLVRLGLVERANVLGRGKDTKTRDMIAAAMERLATPKAMGDLFKVLAVSAPGLKLPVFDA